MVTENLLTYTEVETGGEDNVAVISNRVTWTLIPRNLIGRVHSDKGVGYFSGSFTHLLTFKATFEDSSSGEAYAPWLLANTVDDLNAHLGGAGDNALFLYFADGSGILTLTLYENKGTVNTTDQSLELTLNTVYYLKIVRDEAVGTYGTLYCYIYTDAARTTLFDTLTVTLTVAEDFRYIYPFNNNAASGTIRASGYTEDLELFAAVNPGVTTEPATAITQTTATGHGTITSLGASAASQHGHCWATTIDPTTASSKTTNGVGSLGAFTSAITGLTNGTKYYVRAYATNTQGTAYGANITFTAGNASSQMIDGNFAIFRTEIRYIDAYGAMRGAELPLI